jgi:CspA family cold shock protein
MAFGKVKWWDDNAGFGFITDAKGNDIFAHYTQIQSDDYQTLEEGQEVEFELEQRPRGLMAKNVRHPGLPSDPRLILANAHAAENRKVKVFRSDSIRKLEYEINDWMQDSNLKVISASMTNFDDKGNVCAIVVFSQD